MKLIYQEYQPSSVLEKIVDTYWYNAFEDNQEPHSSLQSCLPHGMVELIIHLNQDRSEGFFKGHWMPFPEAFLVGIMEGPVIWRLPRKTALFGIRFKPESISPLFGFTVKTLANTCTDASFFMNKEITSIIKNMQQAPDNPTRVFFIEAFLLNQISRFHPSKNHFSKALDLIRKADLVYSVDDLSKAVCMSERQLQRVFKGNLGIGPKSYIQIFRFRKIYQILQNKPNVSCHDLAFDFGYADQAHFIRDFKTFSGKTPKKVVLN